MDRGGAADHWAVVVVFVREKRVQYYCSSGESGRDVMVAVFYYLQKHHLSVLGCVLPDIPKWKLINCTTDTPRQNNSYDCAIFTCMFADRLMHARNNSTLFTQSDMNCYRRLMLLYLVDKAVPIWTDTDGSKEYHLAEVLDSST
jgi:Ulp1 family protease